MSLVEGESTSIEVPLKDLDTIKLLLYLVDKRFSIQVLYISHHIGIM